MFDWLFERRVRVRMKLVTAHCDFYKNAYEARSRIYQVLIMCEGRRKDIKEYLLHGMLTPEMNDSMNFMYAGTDFAEVSNFDEIDPNAYVEFECSESTFKKIEKIGHVGYCYSPEIVKVL